MINAVYTRIWNATALTADAPNPAQAVDTPVVVTHTGKATFATLTSDLATGYQLRWHTKTNVASMHLPDALLGFLCFHFGSNVRVCTELYHQNATYRCHPSYQSGGPLYDWFNATQTTKHNNNTTTFPCQLMAVVVTNDV